jgi:hypothetical protein
MAERMDHEAMRRASELPVEGPAASDTLAASGGLEVPGRLPHGSSAPDRGNDHEPIPGEHDNTTAAATLPGIVGTTGYGGDLRPETEDVTLTDEDHERARWQGGGRTGARRESRTSDKNKGEHRG